MPADSSAAQEEPDKWGAYSPNLGFKVANTDRNMSISIYSYARYLNQLGLDSTYTDAFGNVKNVQQRQDFQLNKVQIKFLGWVLDRSSAIFCMRGLPMLRRASTWLIAASTCQGIP